MEEKYYRYIAYYKNYFLDFFNNQSEDVKKKFNWTLGLIKTIERVPSKYLKYMEGTDGLYEIRVEVAGNIYRVFSFFDEDKLIILMNGFQKKSKKTPKQEIELAIKLKKEYYYEK